MCFIVYIWEPIIPTVSNQIKWFRNILCSEFMQTELNVSRILYCASSKISWNLRTSAPRIRLPIHSTCAYHSEECPCTTIFYLEGCPCDGKLQSKKVVDIQSQIKYEGLEATVSHQSYSWGRSCLTRTYPTGGDALGARECTGSFGSWPTKHFSQMPLASREMQLLTWLFDWQKALRWVVAHPPAGHS